MEKGKPKYTIAVIVAGFVLLFFTTGKQHRWLLYFSLIVAVAGTASPVARLWIHNRWMQLAAVMGGISSRILLTVIFFLVLTPLALFYRMFGKKKSEAAHAPSFYVERNHTFSARDLTHLW